MNIKVQKNGASSASRRLPPLLCQKHDTTPRGVHQGHLVELQDIVFEQGQYQNAFRRG